MADVITSAGVTLNDMAYVSYYFLHFGSNHYVGDPKYAKGWFVYFSIMKILPSWFRMAQCLNKYYYSKMGRHLLNFLKYSTKLFVAIAEIASVGINKPNHDMFVLWFFLHLIETLYKLTWDYLMDWGLFLSFKKGSFLLREKMQYSPNFYYFSMVTNAILRFHWLIYIGILSIESERIAYWNHWGYFTLISMMAECYRRTQWALIRVENEFHHNFEQYRSIPHIPSLMDDVKKTMETH